VGQHALGLRGRNDALVLEKSAPAVSPVPVADAVEGEEVRLPVHQEGVSGLHRAEPVIDLVEGCDRRTAEGRGGQVEGDGKTSGSGGGKASRTRLQAFDIALRRMLGRKDQGAPERCATRQAVDPGNRVGHAVHRLQSGERVVEIRSDDRLLPHPSRLDGVEPKGGLEDRSGEPHAADRGGEEARVLHLRAGDDTPVGQGQREPFDMVAEAAVAMMILAVHVRGDHAADRGGEEARVLHLRAGDDTPVGQGQREPFDMVAEAAVAMMVLAVHVRGDHAADGHELRARHHRREKAEGHRQGQDVGQEHPRLDVDPARRAVERADAVEAAGRESDGFPDCGVAVGAAVAAGDETAPVRQEARQGARRLRTQHLRQVPGITPPAGEFHHALRSVNTNVRSSTNLAA
jgi:hypothetical protein